MAYWSIDRLSSDPGSHRPLGLLYHAMLHDSFLRTAALLRTAGTADVAAAHLRAALTAADTEEEDEEESTDDDGQHCQPVVNNEFDFFVVVSSCVSSSLNIAEINSIIPPHHLSDHQVCTVLDGDPSISVLCSQRRLAVSSLLDDNSYSSLSIGTVIGWVLSQRQCRLVGCGVVLQHGVLAEGLEPPSDQDILQVCRGGEITSEGH